MIRYWILLAVAGIFLVSAGFLFGALWATRDRGKEGDGGQHTDHLHE